MPEIIVIATLTAQEGKEADGAQFLSQLLAPTHEDDGCLLYALHRGAENSRKFAFVERWASRSQLEDHLSTSDFKKAMREITKYFVDEPDITMYEPVPAGDPKKGSLA